VPFPESLEPCPLPVLGLGATNDYRGFVKIFIVALAVIVGACGGGSGLDEASIKTIYLNWELEEYGSLASQTIEQVGLIATDGECTAAAIVDADGYDSTIFIRGDDEVVDVLTGHVADWVDGDQDSCFSRP
jgi:hypothetical protein